MDCSGFLVCVLLAYCPFQISARRIRATYDERQTTYDERQTDCRLSFSGLDSFLQNPDIGCGEVACTVGMYNPTFGAGDASQEPWRPGHVRFSVVRGHDCYKGTSDRYVRRRCLWRWIQLQGATHVDPTSEGSRLHSLVELPNVVTSTSGLSTNSPSTSSYFISDGSVSGWLNTQTCVFDLNTSTVLNGATDPRSISVAFSYELRHVSQDLNIVTKELWFDNCGVPRRFVFQEVRGMKHTTRLLYQAGSRPCSRWCQESVPFDALTKLCGTSQRAALIATPESSCRNRQATYPEVIEKNWSPFLYNGESYFVYTLMPLRICKLDTTSWVVGLPKPCSVCYSIPAINEEIFTLNERLPRALLVMGIHSDLDDLQVHLNGIPLLKLPIHAEVQGYLGVGHVWSHWRSTSGKLVRRYASFLFILSGSRPFRVLAVSAPLLLSPETSTAPYWVDNWHEQVEVAFISGAAFTDKNRTLVITYGVGDDQSRLMTMPIEKVMELFHKHDMSHPQGTSQVEYDRDLRGLVEHKSTSVQRAGAPRLFCFMLVMPGTSEVELAHYHLQFGLLSGCEGYAIYSNISNEELLNLPDVPGGKIIDSLTVERGGYWGNVLNAPVLSAAWHHIFESGISRHYDWVVKVDPDTVFLPERLRGLLLEHPRDEASFLVSKISKPPDFSALDGPIEVLSQLAVTAYAANPGLCDRLMQQGDLLEDLHLEHCMRLLGVKAVLEPALLGRTTDECWQSLKVAHHPFKDRRSFADCLSYQRSQQPLGLPSFLATFGRELFGSEDALREVVEHSVPIEVTFGGITINLRMNVADYARYRLRGERGAGDEGLNALGSNLMGALNLTQVDDESPWINIVDIGANLGSTTIAAFKRFPNLTRVVSVEPIPSTYFFLRWNLWLNNVPEIEKPSLANAGGASPGVLLLHRAVSNKEEDDVTLCHDVRNSMEARHGGRCHKPVIVPSISMQGILNLFEKQRITFMNMDCQGCERQGLPPLASAQIRSRIDHLSGKLYKYPDNPSNCGSFERALEDIACAYDTGRYFTVNECEKVRPLWCIDKVRNMFRTAKNHEVALGGV